MNKDKTVKADRSVWGKLLSYFAKYRVVIILALLFEVASMVLQIIGPNLLGNMTNEIASGLPAIVGGETIIGSIDMGYIFTIGMRLIILYVLAGIFGFVDSYIMSSTAAKVSQDMRTSVSQKINRLPLDYFDKRIYGDVLSCVTNDVDTIGQTLNQSLTGLVKSVILFVGVFFMMLYTSTVMAVVAVCSVVIGFVLIGIITKKSQKHFQKQQHELGSLNGYIDEIYTGHSIVKSYNAIAETKMAFEKMNSSLRESGWKSQFLSGLMMPIMLFTGNLGYVAVCVAGAILAMNGTIQFGTVVAFTIYIRLFTQPLAQLAQAMQQLQRTSAASKRIFEFLEEEEQHDESHKVMRLENVKGNVDFRHVSFGYDKGKSIINDFSLKVDAGQKIAIVGPTGAGKTTMVNLLMRFYEITSGEIFLDGTPIRQVTRENTHDQFCMVLQDTWVFEGTIRENIVYSKENVTDEKVERACKAVGLHHFIDTLPEGYNTILNDKTSLSSGQKQLLTIARAMIQDAPLLILDEATSSVDTRTEKLVQEAMDKLTQGRTSFVIAHRLSTIKNSDLILVMKDGDVVERGTHDDLIAENGLYADLYNSQFAPAA
jgi:ATP-binding cassette subfamily B protein